MSLINELNGLTQREYECLLSCLAVAIHTQRRFITILSAERVNSYIVRYKVKHKNSFYPYLIDEFLNSQSKKVYLNMGLII